MYKRQAKESRKCINFLINENFKHVNTAGNYLKASAAMVAVLLEFQPSDGSWRRSMLSVKNVVMPLQAVEVGQVEMNFSWSSTLVLVKQTNSS